MDADARDDGDRGDTEYPPTPSIGDIHAAVRTRGGSPSLMKRIKQSTYAKILSCLERGTRNDVSVDEQLVLIGDIFELIEIWVQKRSTSKIGDIVYDIKDMSTCPKDERAEALRVCVTMLRKKQASLQKERDEYRRMCDDFQGMMEGHIDIPDINDEMSSTSKVTSIEEDTLKTHRQHLENTLAELEAETKSRSEVIERWGDEMMRENSSGTTRKNRQDDADEKEIPSPPVDLFAHASEFDAARKTMPTLGFFKSQKADVDGPNMEKRQRLRSCADEIKLAIDDCWSQDDKKKVSDYESTDDDDDDDEEDFDTSTGGALLNFDGSASNVMKSRAKAKKSRRKGSDDASQDKVTVLSILQKSLRRRRRRLASASAEGTSRSNRKAVEQISLARKSEDDAMNWRLHHKPCDAVLSQRKAMVADLTQLFQRHDAKGSHESPVSTADGDSSAVVSLGLAAASLVVSDIRRCLLARDYARSVIRKT